MKRRHILRKCWLLSFLLLAFATPATAAVSERDWKTTGDGLLTFDDVSNLEWLDLTESMRSLFPIPGVENAIAEIRPGGLFDGFTLGTSSDVFALAESAGIDTTTADFATNHAATSAMINLLGITNVSPPSGGHTSSIGFLADFRPPPPGICPCRFGAIFLINVNSGPTGSAGLAITPSNDLLRLNSNGLMLYREVVPEPSMLVLSGIGILLLIGTQSRRVPLAMMTLAEPVAPGELRHFH